MTKLIDFIKNWWKNTSSSRRTSFIIKVIILLIILTWVYVKYSDSTNVDAKIFYDALDNAQEVKYKEFTMRALNGEVDTLYYHTGNERMVFTLFTPESKEMTAEERADYVYPMDSYRITEYPAGENFRSLMLQYDINLILVKDNTTGQYIMSLVVALLPTIIMVFALIWMISRSMSGINEMHADDIIQKSDVKLDDIIGLDELKDEFNLIINIIKNPSYGKDIGVSMPNGILLSGAPGVGKTMIAKAISNEADVPFLSVNGSDFIELYVGNGARRVRQLFKIARENSPCILFIDEFDAIGEKRDSVKSSSEDSRTINALLKEMDGFKELNKVFVLAATNNPEKLDAAIKRSGRFDREIKITKPRNWETRKLLFEHYLKDKKVGSDVDLDTLARTVAGFTGADISVVCNESGLVALSHGLEYITHDCLEEAIDKKIFKGSRSKMKVNESDRKIVAYHEAGHAIMSEILNRPISRASIQSTTSGVGGMVMNEESESQFRTRQDLIDEVMVCYAGRISEKIKFDSITTGASNDISQATAILNRYINEFGFDGPSGLVDISIIGTVSKSGYTEQQIRKLSISIYDKATSKLRENFYMVEKLAEKLLEVEAMTGKQITEFLNEVREEAGSENEKSDHLTDERGVSITDAGM